MSEAQGVIMSLYRIIIILISALSCLGSHFRGGYFTWTPTDHESQIEISYRMSWRRSAGSHFCNDSHILSRQLLTGEGSLECIQGCSGTMTFLRYYCTDFSESEDWTTGTRTFLYNLTTTFPEISFGFTGCCWISSLRNGGDSSWLMKAKANVAKRMDTGKINSSPVSSISPINRIQYGCNGTISILVSDAEKDEVRCRWANKSDECVSTTCLSFPGAVLNEETCTISYQGNIMAGYYGVAIQVEDFPATGGNVPYSSVPVQFLVDVYSTDQSCYSLPQFIAPTRTDLEIVYLTAGTVYFDQIIANSSVPNKRIVEIITVSPSGFIKSALAEYTKVTGAWYVNITWTPSTSDENKIHILCFKATDEIGLTSQQRCINVIVSPNIDIKEAEGIPFRYGPENKDYNMTNITTNDGKCKLVSKKYKFPMFSSNHSDIYVCVTGIVSFDGPFESPGTDDGSNLKGRAILAPYFNDIDAKSLMYDGNVYYHVYNLLEKEDIKDSGNLRTVVDMIRKIHRDVDTFEAQFALFVTWHQVLPSDANYRQKERMNFQLALVTNGVYTFAFYVYFKDGMKLGSNEVYIGYTATGGQNYMDYRSFTNSVRNIDATARSYGHNGLLHYRLTFPFHGPEDSRQRCINWYLKEEESKEIYNKGLESMPLCPCDPSQLRQDMFYSDIDYFYQDEARCTYILPNWQFSPTDSGKTCCYDRTQHYFLTSRADAGGFIRYHPYRRKLEHQSYDSEMRQACCAENDLCYLYHSVRPIGKCYTTFPAWHAPAHGDPHIKTLDGKNYTFNGWGEFTLVRVKNSTEEFELQARTTRAVRKDGNISDATVFSAFAARDKYDASVHIEMNSENNGLNVYARMASDSMLNDYTSDYMNFNKDFNLASDHLSLSRKKETKDLRVIFSSGIAFTVGMYVSMLNIDVIIPARFRGMTSGLMGNFDGDLSNDFRFKNGTTLPDTIPERYIFEFGKTWAVEPNQSAFWYPRGKDYYDYSYLNYTPKFLGDADPGKLAKARAFCGVEDECVFDLVFTGNEDVANNTRRLEQVSSETDKKLANHAPSINGPKIVNITANKTLTYQLNATDDGKFMYQLIDGHPYVNITQQKNGTATVTIMLTQENPVNLIVTVVDDLGVQATPHQPIIVFCSNCNETGTCDFEDYLDDDRATYTFKYAFCQCKPFWDGPECKHDRDGCATHPCSPLRKCTDVPADRHQVSGVGYNCSECPKGFISTNDGRCEDIDECNATNKVCPHICNNTYGSYICSCYQGYRKSAGSDICQDINECLDGTNNCDQICSNNVGGYSCSCYDGFVFNSTKWRCEAGSAPLECNSLDCNGTAGCTTNEHGNATCFCRKGFQMNLDGSTCVDINECQLALCEHSCTNTDGGFYCSCFSGYSLRANDFSCNPCESPTYGHNCNETCECQHSAIRCDNVKGCICSGGWTGKNCDEDVDECQVPNICNDSFKICLNTNGSYICNCVDGYAINTNGSCQDVDECNDPELNTCQQICQNEAGGFSCSCSPGYVQSKNKTNMCQDIDECLVGQAGCEQICQNSEGRYTCDCYFGYILNNDRKTCLKVENPCSTYKNISCSQICVLDNREVYCSCSTGYTLNSDNQTCADINECSDSTLNRCSANCTNINGGYICSCPAGYQLDNDERTCIVCDAFHYGSNCSLPCNCGIGAVRCDPIGGCLCKTGWSGTNCDKDIDECASHPCTGANSTCINTMGSYVCDCVQGYMNNSGVCQDIDECNDPRQNKCDQICKNAAGSYSCSCHEGFLSNGTKCRDLSQCTESSYGCVCVEGFKLSELGHRTCIPCTNNTFGLNCSYSCPCNILNSLTVNQTCDRINGTCFCKEGWMGADCSQDINECESEPAICQTINNSGCYNMEGSFRCLCYFGYKPNGNAGCMEDVPTTTTPIPITAEAGHTYITSSITLDIKLPRSIDIKVPENYAKMETEANKTLREFYVSKMGQTFERLFILSIRRGSLIVDFIIVTKNSDEALLKLAEANSELAMGEKITLAGQKSTILRFTVRGKELVFAGVLPVDILCNSYLSVAGECASGQECVLVNQRPRCSPIKKKDDLDLYVPIGIGATLFAVLCFVIVVVIIRSRKSKSKTWAMEVSKNRLKNKKKTLQETNGSSHNQTTDRRQKTQCSENLRHRGEPYFNEREAMGIGQDGMPGSSQGYEMNYIPPTKENNKK